MHRSCSCRWIGRCVHQVRALVSLAVHQCTLMLKEMCFMNMKHVKSVKGQSPVIYMLRLHCDKREEAPCRHKAVAGLQVHYCGVYQCYKDMPKCSIATLPHYETSSSGLEPASIIPPKHDELLKCKILFKSEQSDVVGLSLFKSVGIVANRSAEGGGGQLAALTRAPFSSQSCSTSRPLN